MKLQTLRRGTAAAAVLTLSFGLAACGSDDSTDNAGSDTSAEATSDAPAETSAPAEDAGAQTFGDGCASVPTDGAGSFNGMVNDPVATAAGNNPLLKTLVAAVGATELGDTLNSAPALTVFAPYDPAFADIQSTVDDLLAGVPDAETPATSPLAQILAHHVLGENDDPTAVVGEKDTLNGDKLTIEGDETGMTVSDGTVTANVICGNIPTANATVYVIDKVLAGATVK
ncbi:fasciclin domain-containing protein [Nocardioides rubriscoriae]|uniref:fasciclin domain-containing protein n=1 Tax=Nocardioides rubriscoriae TaxID=642762 RepID=UPI0011E02D39|nr:fasciclin domain-containing protein [Nocardioides rubriscoriae]